MLGNRRESERESDLDSGGFHLEAAREHFRREAAERAALKPSDADFEMRSIKDVREFERYYEAVYDDRGAFVHISKSLGVTPQIGDELKIFGRCWPRGADLVSAADGSASEIYYRTPAQQERYIYELEAHRREARGDNW